MMLVETISVEVQPNMDAKLVHGKPKAFFFYCGHCQDRFMQLSGHGCGYINLSSGLSGCGGTHISALCSGREAEIS